MTQPETALDELREGTLISRLPQAWHMPLARIVLAWAALIALTRSEWAEMIHQWWNIDTYTHILLIPPLIIWLTVLRREGLAKLTPAHWFPGIFVVAAALAVWLAGKALDINLIAQVGAVGALQACLLTFLGPRLT
ncbi:MAG: archaeosortase/exosortase family protein, partial [Marinomonas sp.]